MNMKHWFLTIGLVVLCGALPAEASAHAHLKSASPAPGSIVAVAPQEVRIEFSEGIEPSMSGIEIVGASGPVAAAGKAFIDQAKPRTLIVRLAQPLAPGPYEARWRCAGKDGHMMRGDFHFVVRS